MEIFNTTKNTVIADRVAVANTPLSKMVGLLNRATLKKGEALVIPSCRAIHMFFMKFPIDAIFVDKENRVVGCVDGIRPFSLSPVFWQASFVIEVPVGTIGASRTEIGDLIELRN